MPRARHGGKKDKKSPGTVPSGSLAAGSIGHARHRVRVSGYGRVGFRAGNPSPQLAKNKRPYAPTMGDRCDPALQMPIYPVIDLHLRIISQYRRYIPAYNPYLDSREGLCLEHSPLTMSSWRSIKSFRVGMGQLRRKKRQIHFFSRAVYNTQEKGIKGKG